MIWTRLSLGGIIPLFFISACTHSQKDKKSVSGSEPIAVSTSLPKGLYATLETAHGEILVRLLPDEAPKAVANFVDLATGKKEWQDPITNQPTRRALYDGTHFFRVIPGFMVQGGDPKNDGTGGPGYQFEDEIYPSRDFDKAGFMAMASSGPHTNGSQFFLTLAPAPWLKGKHTVFGEVVRGQEVLEAIAKVERVTRDPASGWWVDRPKQLQVLNRVRIERR